MLRKKRIWRIVLTVLAALVVREGCRQTRRVTVTECAGQARVAQVTTLKESGGRVDWSWTKNLIAFDRIGDDGYYGVYTMQPDGSSETCLTCGKAGLVPQKHKGNPAWHPSGDYLVFQAEKEGHGGVSFAATPGLGTYSDLWLMSSDGRQFYQLTDIPNGPDHGVLHPSFSHDGEMLAWSEMYSKPNLRDKPGQFGYWKLKVADFSIGRDGPTLSNIREYQPGGPGFYENHGFSPDGTQLLFSGSFEEGKAVLENTNIYSMSLADGSLAQLTIEAYNEHARYSPDGKKIVWMSNRENSNKGTDYWLMNADGSNKERLTYFNQPGCPGYTGDRIVMADNSWSPDGRRVVAYMQTNLIAQTGKTVKIDLPGSD